MSLADNIDTFGHVGGITVRSTAAGSTNTDTGVYTKGTTTDVAGVAAIVYPSTAREVLRLPEGLREREAITVITRTQLAGPTVPAGAHASRVKPYGYADWYEVQARRQWPSGDFFDAICTKVEA